MPNKKINALDVRTAVATDLMLVGDPTSGTAYKSTLANLPLVPYTGATGAVSLGLFGLTAGTLTLQPQALNSSTYKITQQMASNDYWSIYGFASVADYGDLYFELQDNAAFADGQRFRFHYGNASSGTPKDILVMDYNSATFDGAIIKSGGTSAQILAADGSVITAGTNITISGGTISASGGGAGMAIGGAITSATAGSVLFAGASGVLQQDNANLFWDDTNNRLGIGTATPSVALELGTTTLGAEQLINPTIGSTNIAPTITAGNYTTSGYTISGGVYSKTSAFGWQGGSTNAVIVNGNSYQVTLTFNTWTSGTGVNVYLGGIFLFRVTTTGTYTKKITAVNTDQLIFDSNTSLYSINSIIINNISLGNITLGGKLKLLGNISAEDGTSAISILPNGGTHVLNNLLIATNWSTTQNDQGSKYPSRVAKLEIVGDDSFTGNYIRLITKASSQFCYTNFVHEISNFKIQQYINGTSYPNAFVIDNGNILLNTATNAGYRLDVNGTARVSGDMVVNGLTIGTGGSTTTIPNTAFGNGALNATTTGTGQNLAFGFQAMSSLTTGSVNTAIGYRSSNALTTATNNVAVGVDTLRVATTSSNNVAIGTLSLNALTTSTGNNVAIGFSSGKAMTTASTNVAIGSSSLGAATTGGGNTAIGNEAMDGLTTGTNNVAVGSACLGNASFNGSNNVAIGQAAAGSQTSGSDSVVIGTNAMVFQTTGGNNIAIGTDAARRIGAGGNNTITNQSIFIGQDTRPLAISQTNQIVIGYNETGLGSNTTIIGNSSTITTALRGRLLLGNTTDSGLYQLDVNGTARVSGTSTFGNVNLGSSSSLTVPYQLYVSLIRGIVNDSVYILPANIAAIGVDIAPSFNTSDNSISGTRQTVGISLGFNPTSGTAVRNQLSIAPIINQTGTASGISRGIIINPTLTAAADWRAIEIASGGVYVNTTSVQASAIFQTDSTTKGFLPPRMTTTQINAIATPAEGLMAYNTTISHMCVYQAGTWVKLSHSPM